MSETDAAIDDYLTRYAADLTAFDAKASADLWSTPGMLVDDRFTGVLESRDAMVEALEQSYPLYKELGLASVGHELLRQEQLSGTVTLVQVRWLFFDDDGEQLTDSTSWYLLRRDDEGLRACVCIQVDDLEKLEALAAERGVALPSPPP